MDRIELKKQIVIELKSAYDIGILLLNDNLLLKTPQHFVFYNNTSFNDSVNLSKTNCNIDFEKLDKNITTILIIAFKNKTKHSAYNYDINFKDITRVNFTNLNNEVCTLVKENDKWILNPLNIVNNNSINEIISLYTNDIILK